MSFSYFIALDARAAFQALDVHLQERVLDELEVFIADENRIQREPSGKTLALPAMYSYDAQVDVVVIMLVIDHARRRIEITGFRLATE